MKLHTLICVFFLMFFENLVLAAIPPPRSFTCYSCNEFGLDTTCAGEQEWKFRVGAKTCPSQMCFMSSIYTTEPAEKQNMRAFRECVPVDKANNKVVGCETETIGIWNTTKCYCNTSLCNSNALWSVPSK